MSIKLFITDDHQMFIDGLKLGLKTYEDIEIVGEANNGRKLLTELQLKSVDVLLLDINMPLVDGVEAMQVISEHHKNLKVIVVSTYTL